MIQNTASLAQNEKGEKVIKVSFSFDLDMLDKVRSIPGRKYYPEDKFWSAPLSIENIEQLQKWDYKIDSTLNSYSEKAKEKKAEISLNGIPGLKGTPRPFQNVAAAFAEDKNGRFLNADDQGIGKTIETLMWIQLHRNKIPVAIICPASLKLNWERETEKWLPNPFIEILSGTKIWKTSADILILNYDIAFAWLPELKRRNLQILVLDECHALKASSARRTKAVKKIAKGIPHILALSGTPILNRPVEIYNTIQIINPDLFPNFMAFTLRYCNRKHNGFGWTYNGSSHADELNSILLSNCMIRRKKQDVLKELPDKVYSFVPMALDNLKEYKEAEKSFIAYIRQTKGNEAAERIKRIEQLAKIEGLKQLAVQGKLLQVIDWIKEFLETGNKLVVFCVHKFVVNSLMTEFKEIAVKIDGSVATNKRQILVDAFQNDEKIRLFVGNIKAAGEGITLTASSNVAILELPWSPKTIDQAGDRVHRIGQKDSVTIYYLLAQNTIEEKIAKLLDAKRKTVDAVVDGEDTSNENLLHALMNSYK
jgi:SWI/SNF-related matrix-associated actin-dependent regulator 1 of chromatin subfamily A